MAKLHYVEKDQEKPKGVIVASLFKVDRVNGYSLKFKAKVRNEKNELVDMTGEKLLDIAFGESMLVVPNNRKREGKRDPEYIVYAYPDQKPYKKEA